MGSGTRNIVAVLLVWGVSACSSSTSAPNGLVPGSATLVSTVPTMGSRSWASAALTQTDGGGPSIVVTNVAGVADSCLAASAHSDAADAVSLAFAFDSNQMPAPGTYDMAGAWQATLRRSDSRCATLTEESAVQGLLSIDSVDGTVRGTADVTFPSGRLIATFNAPSCAAPNGNASICTVYPVCPAGPGAEPPAPTDACLAWP